MELLIAISSNARSFLLATDIKIPLTLSMVIKIDRFTQELSDYGSANLLRSLGHPDF